MDQGDSGSLFIDDSDLAAPVEPCEIAHRAGRCLVFRSLTLSVPADLMTADSWVVGSLRFESRLEASGGVYRIAAIEAAAPTPKFEYSYTVERGVIAFKFVSSAYPAGWRASSPYALTSPTGLLH